MSTPRDDVPTDEVRERLAAVVGSVRGETYGWLNDSTAAGQDVQAMHRRLADEHLLPVVDDLVARALAEQRKQIVAALTEQAEDVMGDYLTTGDFPFRIISETLTRAADIVREVGKP